MLIFYRYVVKFNKMKIELKRKRSDSLFSSRLFLYLVTELILCSILVPPFVDWSFSGRMLGG